MTASPTSAKPAAPVPTPLSMAVSRTSKCKSVAQVIAEIAIQILAPFASSLLLFFTLPVSISAIAIPVAAVASAFAVTFFFAHEQAVKKPEPKLALPTTPAALETVPSGLANAGNDCWLNSISQMMRCDKGMTRWFSEVPNNLDQYVPFLDHLSAVQLLIPIPAVLPPAVYGTLDAAGQAALNTRVQWIRGMTDANRATLYRYLDFLREPRDAEPLGTAEALVAFKNFMDCYEVAPRGKPVVESIPEVSPKVTPVVTPPDSKSAAPTASAKKATPPKKTAEPALYKTANLRLALSKISPFMSAENKQQDTTAAIRAINNCLLPSYLKLELRVRNHFDIDGKPPIPGAVDGKIIEGVGESPIALSIKGDAPNIRDRLVQYFNEKAESGNRIKRTIGGVEYEYFLTHIESQVVRAPESLWIVLNRQHSYKPLWAGLHRLLPNWLNAKPQSEKKVEAVVEVQDTIGIQPIEGPVAQYKNDGFIVNVGEDNKSHYVSYKLGKDDEGNDAWYQMNDRTVSSLSNAQKHKIRESGGLIFHYSKIE